MTTYVDVGVERIHSYLSRSRHLWGRRGASESLVRLTTLPDSATKLAENQRQALAVALLLADPQFSGHVRLNGEGLDIDGVVSLVSEDHELSLLAGHSLALASIHRLTLCVCLCLWIPSGIDVTRVCGHA